MDIYNYHKMVTVAVSQNIRNAAFATFPKLGLKVPLIRPAPKFKNLSTSDFITRHLIFPKKLFIINLQRTAQSCVSKYRINGYKNLKIVTFAECAHLAYAEKKLYKMQNKD